MPLPMMDIRSFGAQPLKALQAKLTMALHGTAPSRKPHTHASESRVHAYVRIRRKLHPAQMCHLP
jgi:hypothetical protein